MRLGINLAVISYSVIDLCHHCCHLLLVVPGDQWETLLGFHSACCHHCPVASWTFGLMLSSSGLTFKHTGYALCSIMIRLLYILNQTFYPESVCLGSPLLIGLPVSSDTRSDVPAFSKTSPCVSFVSPGCVSIPEPMRTAFMYSARRWWQS